MVAQIVYEQSSPAVGRASFAMPDERRRLTPAAVEGFKGVMDAWGVGNSEAAALIGVSVPTWSRIKGSRGTEELTQDQLTRVSAVLGIFKALEILFVGPMARRWPTLKNRGPVFRGRAPVEAMIEGGIPALLETRQYLDALRGGL